MPSAPILIGITGNYGSGKSSFCKLLLEKGFTVVFADEIAQKYLDDPASLKQIGKRWGRQTIHNGKADRHKIAHIVFNNKQELDWLNKLLHPKTLAELQSITDSSQEKYLFFEIPILFEAGMQRCFDFIVLMHTALELRLRRLLKREGVSAAEIEDRMANQIDDSEKIPLCNLVIDNSFGLRKLRSQTDAFVSMLSEIRPKDKLPFYT